MEEALFAVLASAYVALLAVTPAATTLESALGLASGSARGVAVVAALKVAPILLLARRVVRGPTWTAAYRRATALGLLLSGAGDVFLALDSDFFLPGLAAFLLAHVCYVAAFGFSLDRLHLARGLPVAAAGAAYYGLVLAPAVPASLSAPVLAYVVVIVTMVWRSAAAIGGSGGSGGRRRAAWVGLVGAVLFLLSDCVLAYNLFVQPIAFGRIGTMVPYYLGQLGIALSALGTPTSPATTKASSKATNATPNASSKAPKETKRA